MSSGYRKLDRRCKLWNRRGGWRYLVGEQAVKWLWQRYWKKIQGIEECDALKERTIAVLRVA